MPGVYIVHTPAELTQILERISKESLLEPRGASAVAAGILDKILK